MFIVQRTLKSPSSWNGFIGVHKKKCTDMFLLRIDFMAKSRGQLPIPCKPKLFGPEVQVDTIPGKSFQDLINLLGGSFDK